MCTWQMQRDLFRLTEEQRRRDTRYTHHWARLQRRPGARIAALLIRWWPEIPRRRPAGGQALLLDINADSLLAHACAVAGRNLTPDEWTQLMPSRPYQRTCPDQA
jgi:hypothetical protein